ERKKTLMRTVEQVRRLWAGEELAFPGTAGTTARVLTQPRPVQPELPVWITAAGHPETFRAAGTAGYGVMTALLGQTLPQLRENGDGDEPLLLEAAFQDYLAGPSLLGTPAKAARVLARLAEAGADEVGCLVDFGLPAGDVLAGLPRLAELLPADRPTPADADRS